MKILDMPDSSRPRERFLKVGAEALSDAEEKKREKLIISTNKTFINITSILVI
ncbi:MAG: hypothetical protein NTZ83_05555 [Candidatus Pacearchaeota archaeon]|nr:hypothetical protein [Candidatus Pacearchaeota archaeon]